MKPSLQGATFGLPVSDAVTDRSEFTRGSDLQAESTRELTQNRDVAKNLISQMFVLIFLQRFMLFHLSVVLIYFALAMSWLFFKGCTRVSMTQLALYMAMLGCAMFGQLDADTMSAPSLTLLAILTSTYTLSVRMSWKEYQEILNKFSLFMIVPAILVFLQYGYQTMAGAGNSLKFEMFVPSQFLLRGFMAESSTANWVVWNRPNGIVFLEPSFCSAFLACAIVIELEYFKRFSRIALFAAALVATNGGTGWLIIGIAVPVLGLMRYPVFTIVAGVAAVVAVVFAQQFLSDLPLFSRLGEFHSADSSGYGRILLPLATAVHLLLDVRYLIAGHGAGQITPAFGAAWPLVKIIYEYGVVTAVLYTALFVTAILGIYSVPMRISIFVIFQFTGGYLLSPFMGMLVFVMFTAFRPDEWPDIRQRRGRLPEQLSA